MLVRTLAALGAAAAALTIAVPPAQADPPSNVIVGTPGNDVLIGTNKTDLIVGLPGNDVLVGGRKADALAGGWGRDVLRAAGKHSGTDLLRGGRGRDRCVGDDSDVFLGCEVIRIR
jgi:Ca2+-binding RTX toxin-like protein